MTLSKLFLVLAFTVSSNLYADQPLADNKPDFDELVTQLQLEESNVQQLKSMMENHRQQRETAHTQRQKNHEMREQHRAELLTVLSYEQLYKFEQYMQQFHRGHQRKLQQY